MVSKTLQQQVLELPTGDRWQLVQVILASLRADMSVETQPNLKPRNLSRLRGIAKPPESFELKDPKDDYIDYLIQKYE